ncbi:polysaccharide biosynthesis/export family protein [Synechococcus sp. WH 8103]|nr:polysaccharide biosynthesis/export family protein [Synechococcus sp. WH 8103]
MNKSWLSIGTLAASLVFTPALLRAQPAPSEATQSVSLSTEERSRVIFDAYILGPGDGLDIELLDLPALSGRFTIGPDGTIYLPRLRALYVEGLTVEELRLFLTDQFRPYVRDPEVYIRPVRYRPIRVYVGGEVKRPGYYSLSGDQELQRLSESAEQTTLGGISSPARRGGLNQLPGGATAATSGAAGLSTFGLQFPTVFDAIRAAQGITPFTDLSKVQVTRRQAASAGGGRIRTNLDFLSLITTGDESQNIRLFDGDVVSVAKSPEVLREQLLKAGQTNLTPQFMQVYVSGRVRNPGAVTLPQGSSLVQAIDLAGGTKLLHGKVEFIRFTREGEIDRRIFGFKSDAPADDYRNPVLMTGDVVRLRESIASAGIEVLNEITAPAVGLYSVYSIYRDVQP